jgi:hypothetical protein
MLPVIRKCWKANIAIDDLTSLIVPITWDHFVNIEFTITNQGYYSIVAPIGKARARNMAAAGNPPRRKHQAAR